MNLTDGDVRYLIEFEDELIRKGSFELVFPLGNATEHYLNNIRKPIYSNLLLTDWQKYQTKYGRQKGIEILEQFCREGYHISRNFLFESKSDTEQKAKSNINSANVLKLNKLGTL